MQDVQVKRLMGDLWAYFQSKTTRTERSMESVNAILFSDQLY